ncbi:(d)CMP kinase [Kurthia zopfii]|nr:(d)CMP kinase [Kurthia zopfii]
MSFLVSKKSVKFTFCGTILRKKGLNYVTKKIQIAIDGPAGAGKSTIAKIAAEKLGYTYIDTGAMYRALTLKALTEKIDLSSEQAVTDLLKNSTIELKPSPQGQLVFLDGVDVSSEIRSNEVTSNVSKVAAHASMRAIMVELQYDMAVKGGVIMDGRDIGTAVLPKAELKIFMSATVEERARRRFEDNQQRGIESSFESLKEEIALRDKMDSEREASPLVQAEDAIFVDTTHLNIEQSAEEILKLATERMS